MAITHKYNTGHTVVSCNACFDPEVSEKFYLRMPYVRIAQALKRLGWTFKHRHAHVFAHYCPKCTLINRTSANYQERIHA